MSLRFISLLKSQKICYPQNSVGNYSLPTIPPHFRKIPVWGIGFLLLISPKKPILPMIAEVINN